MVKCVNKKDTKHTTIHVFKQFSFYCYPCYQIVPKKYFSFTIDAISLLSSMSTVYVQVKAHLIFLLQN